MSKNPKKPDCDLVNSYLKIYNDKSKGYIQTDNAIFELFKIYPQNKSYEEILLKAAIINGLYRTNIFAIYIMAEHIYELSIDKKLSSFSVNLVNEIANLQIKKKRHFFFSFASKYCSFHFPQYYPIYDSKVGNLIWLYQNNYKFHPEHFFKYQINEEYSKYKGIVEQFVNYFGLKEFTFKEIDKFLWLYAQDLNL